MVKGMGYSPNEAATIRDARPVPRNEFQGFRSAIVRLRGQKSETYISVPVSAQADNRFVEDTDFDPGNGCVT